MHYKIFVLDRDVNDATSFYIDIIRNSILAAGSEVFIVNTLDEINDNDIVIVVKITSAYRVLRKNKNQRVIIWLQGIQPEEMIISDTPILKKLFYFVALRYLEYFIFKHVHFMIYVSREMKRHYERRYGKNNKLIFEMPCFNLSLNSAVFSDEKRYKNPSFVYAGSLDAWQCFEKTLKVFKLIQRTIPDASLTILTKNTEEAKRIVTKNSVTKVVVKYIPKEKVQDELMKYKYGFILRDDIEVNRVATPTKLNSYMASGVIPIVSKSLTDFIDNTSNCKYICRISDTSDVTTIVKEIIDFERLEIMNKEITEEYEKVFSKYYNRDNYIDELSKAINHYQNGLMTNYSDKK